VQHKVKHMYHIVMADIAVTICLSVDFGHRRITLETAANYGMSCQSAVWIRTVYMNVAASMCTCYISRLRIVALQLKSAVLFQFRPRATRCLQFRGEHTSKHCRANYLRCLR